jgi:hypothetical protein
MWIRSAQPSFYNHTWKGSESNGQDGKKTCNQNGN